MGSYSINYRQHKIVKRKCKRRGAKKTAREVDQPSFRHRIAKPQGIAHHGYGTHGHGRGGEHRVEQHAEERIEHSGRDGNAQHVVEEGPEKVLSDDFHGHGRKPDGRNHQAQIVLDESDIARFHRDVGPRSDGDPHVGRGQGRRIVDAVSHHGHQSAFLLDAADFPRLVPRKHLRHDPLDSHLTSDGLRGFLPVPGNHGDFQAHFLELRHRSFGGILQFVGKRDGPGGLPVYSDVDARLPRCNRIAGPGSPAW